jgi:hypothetical protein
VPHRAQASKQNDAAGALATLAAQARRFDHAMREAVRVLDAQRVPAFVDVYLKIR